MAAWFERWLTPWDDRILHWVGMEVYDWWWGHWARQIGLPTVWATALLVVAIVLLIERRLKGLAVLVHVLVVVGVCNTLSSQVLKHAFNRPRPCLVHPEYKFSSTCYDANPSFPSSHAANSMAIAVTALQYHPIYGALLLGASIVGGAARVYVGVHYPSDVLFGWLLGALVSMVMAWGLSWLARRLGFRSRLQPWR